MQLSAAAEMHAGEIEGVQRICQDDFWSAVHDVGGGGRGRRRGASLPPGMPAKPLLPHRLSRGVRALEGRPKSAPPPPDGWSTGRKRAATLPEGVSTGLASGADLAGWSCRQEVRERGPRDEGDGQGGRACLRNIANSAGRVRGRRATVESCWPATPRA